MGTRVVAVVALVVGTCVTVGPSVAGEGPAPDTEEGRVSAGPEHSDDPAAKFLQALEDMIRVPAGTDWRAPPGADMSEGLPEQVPALPTEAPARRRSGEWVLVPIPFKNPLLGVGIQGGVARLYQAAGEPENSKASMYGVGGMYSDNGSSAAFAADRRYWAGGDVRTTVAGGTGEVRYELDLHAAGTARNVGVKQEFRGAMIDVSYDATGKLWLGAGVKVGRLTTNIPGLQGNGFGERALFPGVEYRLGIADLKAEWDSRSDEFYPTDGVLARADIKVSTAALASDSDYVRFEFFYNSYQVITDTNTVAWRLSAMTVTGAAPFFALPWYGSGVDLRGYTPGVYVGRSLLAAQAEWRWQATHKLGFVAFAGAGGVYGKIPAFRQDDWLPAGGVGLRWRVTEKYRVNFRVDYAWGKNDQVLLISVGEAF